MAIGFDAISSAVNRSLCSSLNSSSRIGDAARPGDDVEQVVHERGALVEMRVLRLIG